MIQDGYTLTVVGVLSSNISHGIADLVADRSLGLVGERLEQFLSDGYSLVCWQRDKHLRILALVILARFRGDPAKDDGGERSDLWSKNGVSYKPLTSTPVCRDLESALTAESCDAEICSARPINKISGLVFVQLFCRCSSAWERVELSGDCRACKSCVSSAWISCGRIDMVSRSDEALILGRAGVSSRVGMRQRREGRLFGHRQQACPHG